MGCGGGEGVRMSHMGDESPPTKYEKWKVKAKKKRVVWGGRIKERGERKGGKKKPKWKGRCAWGERRGN